MKGILLYEKESAQYNAGGIAIYLTTAKKHGIELTVVYYEDITYGTEDGQYYVQESGKTLMHIDFVINRCRDYLLARHFEAMKIRVFNSALVNEIGNHKGLTCEYLAQYGIAMPVTTTTIENRKLSTYLTKLQETVVVKAVHGHGGSQVCLYEPGKLERIDEICGIMDGEDVVVQPYIKGRGQDVRVYVIGNEIIGAVLRTATKDFRSNYSLGGKVEAYDLDKEEISRVQQILDVLSFDYAGIDFMIKEDGSLLFNEIEDVVGARMLYQCTNLDAISLYMEYIAKTIV